MLGPRVRIPAGSQTGLVNQAFFMPSKPVLIILTPGFPHDESDTTCMPPQQVFVKSLIKQFPSIDVTVLSFHYPYFKSEYKYFGSRVFSFNGMNKGGICGLIMRFKIWKKLEKLNKENRIVGLLSFWYADCAFMGKKFAQKNNLKHFCWVLGQDAKKNNKYVERGKPQANELIALSDFIQAEFLLNHGVKPAHLIPPGIDPTLYENTFAPKDIDVLGAGSLIPLKHYEVFVEIIQELETKISFLRSRLCGKGPLEPELRKLINETNVNSNLELTGELPHKEVLNLMQRSKVFLHTSDFEGFGVVCIEALHAGCHVISFTQPMNQTITNWHVVNNKEEMIKKTLELLTDSKTNYKPVTPYVIDDTARAMMKLFNYTEPAR